MIFGPVTAVARSHKIARVIVGSWLVDSEQIISKKRLKDFLAFLDEGSARYWQETHTVVFPKKIQIIQKWQQCIKNQGFLNFARKWL